MLRSLLALAAGYLASAAAIVVAVWVVETFFFDTVSESFSPAFEILLATGALVGGYVSAFVATRARLEHALIFGAILFALCLGVYIGGDEGNGDWLGLLAILPAAGLGGKLRVWQVGSKIRGTIG